MGARTLLFLNNQGLGGAGGGVTILRALVAGLTPDHAVTVASLDPPGPAPDGVRQVTLPAVPDSSWHLTPLARARHLARVLPPALLAAADTVVAMDCHFGPALAALPAERVVYLSLSCIPRQEWFAAPAARMIPRVTQYAWLERGLARRAGQVVVASRRHAAELARFEAVRRAPVILHPVFPAEKLPPRPGRAIARRWSAWGGWSR